MKDLIGRTLRHYRIVHKIGEGGMGVVYQANDERLDRVVSIDQVCQSEYSGIKIYTVRNRWSFLAEAPG